MEDFISCEQSVDLDFEMIFTTREMCLFLPSQVHINFLFSCEPVFVHWVLHQGSIYPEFERLDRSPLISNFTQVSLEDLMSNDPARRAIEDILNDWPVLENWRRTFIDDVIIKAQDRARNMPCHHNVVFLEFNVAVVHQHIFDEGRALNSTIQQLMEEDNIISCMIPATDSSIESLETKILTDIGTCSVCLEDFPVNGDCDGASMPLIARQAQESAEGFKRGWRGPLLNSDDVVWIRGETVGRDTMTKELNRVGPERAFRSGIGETKRHHDKLIVTIGSSEGCFMNIGRMYPDLKVSLAKIKLRKNSGAFKFIEELVNAVRAYVNRLGAGVEVNMMVMCVMRGQVCWSVEHGCKFSEEMSELGVRGFGSVGLWKKYVDVGKTGDGVCGDIEKFKWSVTTGPRLWDKALGLDSITVTNRDLKSGGGGVGCAREGVKRDGEKRGIRIGFIGQESVEVVFRGG
ncbi:hypothetical protein BUALT_BualtUnG0031000 [Buddleja alternifolia]|uniref:Uncharacterized protein n=1 Tax=Buddleja alternifolia TaxID=168488 RepID=A0AAV6W782_9LAMI|nr:hypothetical protein BUALT_BualtUnG0031000 [Buddleja alternifolia]